MDEHRCCRADVELRRNADIVGPAVVDQLAPRGAGGNDVGDETAAAAERVASQLRFWGSGPGEVSEDRAGAQPILDTGPKGAIGPLFTGGNEADARAVRLSGAGDSSRIPETSRQSWHAAGDAGQRGPIRRGKNDSGARVEAAQRAR